MLEPRLKGKKELKKMPPIDISRRIRRHMTKAIASYNMLKEGDHVMVAVSGGKDSTILLLLMQEIQKKAPFRFTFEGVLLDQKQPGFQPERYKAWLLEKGLSLTIIEEDTYTIVQDKIEAHKTFCGLCSRLRRGILYNYADKHKFTKIALGHHQDDLNETLLLNLFYSGRVASMPPKLYSDDGRNTVIRPLMEVPESWLSAYEKELNIPVIPCNLCGSQENLRRKEIKKLISHLETDIPGVRSSMLTAMKNIRPSQLLDQDLQNFDH